MIILFIFIRYSMEIIFIREIFTSGPLMCSSHQSKHYHSGSKAGFRML